jgi:hypothetical protein
MVGFVMGQLRAYLPGTLSGRCGKKKCMRGIPTEKGYSILVKRGTKTKKGQKQKGSA